MRRNLIYVFGLVVAVLLVVLSNQQLNQGREAKPLREELSISMPALAQLLMAGGDRFLAANINVFRVNTVGIHAKDPESMATQARLQGYAAVFNPAHEDNYYIAEALLPDNGQLDQAQIVLRLAIEARPTDLLPAFFYAFNLRQYLQDHVSAVRVLTDAAARAEGNNKLALQAMAARWLESADDASESRRLVLAMAEQAQHPGLKQLLVKRAERLAGLATLRTAVADYRQQFGQVPDRLEQLVEQGVIEQLPTDPLGFGYRINEQGKVLLNNRPPPKS